MTLKVLITCSLNTYANMLTISRQLSREKLQYIGIFGTLSPRYRIFLMDFDNHTRRILKHLIREYLGGLRYVSIQSPLEVEVARLRVEAHGECMTRHFLCICARKFATCIRVELTSGIEYQLLAIS